MECGKEHVDIPREQRKHNNRASYTEGGVLSIFKPNISFPFLWDKTISHRNYGFAPTCVARREML